MNTIIIKVLVIALALLLADAVVPGVQIASVLTAVLAGVVLGLLNAVVRPLLVLLTLPVTIVTLGLFIVVINAAMVALAAAVVDGFVVDGVLAAVLASFCVTVVSVVLNTFLKK